MIVQVVEQERLTRDVFRLWIEMEQDTPWSPGQFFHVRVGEGLDHVLRRPISLSEAVADRRFALVYRVVGAGTRWLAGRRPGSALDVLGPLGRGFPLHPGDGRVLVIGGGVGVPPLIQLAREVRRRGVEVTAVVGFREARDVMLVDELAALGPVRLLTEDGSAGMPGRVTDALEEDLLRGADRFYACGPSPMLQAVQGKLSGHLPGYLSLEERMGCGIGVCMGCVHLLRRADGSPVYRRVCADGPVFPAEEVAFS